MAAVFHRLLPNREGLAPRYEADGCHRFSLPKVGRLAFYGLADYLGEVVEKADGLTVSAAIDHGAERCPNIMLGHTTD
ncbi:hypothetical protein [Pseudomonas sp.]|uniref:hypothetical protein n=1 Tax=Pseudomonas sp. TaxID=306 RepID=UPI00258D9499|nr:hypothetical protein [Pseudomonas sp.]